MLRSRHFTKRVPHAVMLGCGLLAVAGVAIGTYRIVRTPAKQLVETLSLPHPPTRGGILSHHDGDLHLGLQPFNADDDVRHHGPTRGGILSHHDGDLHLGLQRDPVTK